MKEMLPIVMHSPQFPSAELSKANWPKALIGSITRRKMFPFIL